MDKYPNLFSPLKVGGLTLKSRIVTAPMGHSDLTPEGYITPANIATFESWAKGGAAVVTIGESLVHPSGKSHARIIPLYDEEGIMPSLIGTFDAIKRHGAYASIELIHAGIRSNPKYTNGRNPLGPSSGMNDYGAEIEEMNEDQIAEIVEAFGRAAFVAKFAGADMCMVHAGHGWLLAQFLSPLNNRRTDRFGGSLENRARLTLMVIESIRRHCGRDFPIELRISGSELLDGGITLEDSIGLAKMVEDKVDLIHVSATTFYSPLAGLRMFPNMFLPRGCNVFLAEAIKKEVNIPVVTVGGISQPQHMEEILQSNKADLIAMARAILADPMLPKKIKNGKEEEVNPCIRCCHCISASFVPHIPIASRVLRCTVNPDCGREFDSRFTLPETSPKKVLIAGGGPGGMKAAIAAHDRGHEVILCEKSASLGGKLNLLEDIPFKKDLIRFSTYLINNIEKRDIDLRLNTEVTPELVKEIAPHILIAAIGGEPIIPPIEGIENTKVINIVDALEKKPAIGEKVVIIGGGLVGCEEGLNLAKQGKSVTILEMKNKAAEDAPFLHWKALMLELEEALNLKTGYTCTKITDEGVFAQDAQGNGTLFSADTILLSAGLKPIDTQWLRPLAPEFILVGDAIKTGTLLQAVHTGENAGRHI